MKTNTERIPENVGFPKTMEQGFTLSDSEQFAQMRKNGFTIEHTPEGIIITPPVGKIKTKLPKGYR